MTVSHFAVTPRSHRSISGNMKVSLAHNFTDLCRPKASKTYFFKSGFKHWGCFCGARFIQDTRILFWVSQIDHRLDYNKIYIDLYVYK